MKSKSTKLINSSFSWYQLSLVLMIMLVKPVTAQEDNTLSARSPESINSNVRGNDRGEPFTVIGSI